MKKIYSKFTKDRRKEFQIETFVAEENGTKLVAKKAICKEAQAHISKMADFYQARKDDNLFCPSKMQDQATVVFSFLKGQSLCKEMLADLAVGDMETFHTHLAVYGGILDKSADVQMLSAEEVLRNKEFCRVFGGQQLPENGKQEENAESPLLNWTVANNLDIDLTFDNIINEETVGGYRIIDYEWFFPFPVPMKYVMWRACFAFYIKYASLMNGKITLQDLYDTYGISKEEEQIFEAMNAGFDRYVYGESHAVLKRYRKDVYPVKALLPKDNLVFQIFANAGNGYSEDLCVTKGIEGHRADFTVALSDGSEKSSDSDANTGKKSEGIGQGSRHLKVSSGEVQEIRIDPINMSGSIRDVHLYVELIDGTEEEVKEYQHNATISDAGEHMFVSEDPQYIFANKWGNKISAIRAEFEVVSTGVGEEMLRKILEETQKELTFIRESRIYKTMLESKIDKLMGR